MDQCYYLNSLIKFHVELFSCLNPAHGYPFSKTVKYK